MRDRDVRDDGAELLHGVPIGSPGCSDVDCCRAVCAADSFCFTVARDAICAETATATYAACGDGCSEDIDSDGILGPADLGILLGGWGTAVATDLDGDGTTGPADLALLVGA